MIKNDNCILFFQLHFHVFLRIGFQFSKTCFFSFTMRRNDRNCTHANIKGIRGFTFSHDLYDKTCIGASWRAKYVKERGGNERIGGKTMANVVITKTF